MRGRWPAGRRWARGRCSCCRWCSRGTWRARTARCRGSRSRPTSAGCPASTSGWWRRPSRLWVTKRYINSGKQSKLQGTVKWLVQPGVKTIYQNHTLM